MAIETLSNPTPQFSRITDTGDFRADAVADGYALECSCGELYRSVASAIHCRKCRNYCVFGRCTHVVDIRTMEVVAGRVPSQEEYRQAAMEASARWEQERKDLDRYIQMKEKSGPAWDAHLAEQALLKAEAVEDELWATQDRMSGVR